MEIQQRGSPHIHMVFWTGKTSDESMQEDNLAVCQFPDQQQNKELYDLVNKLQIHACGNYIVRVAAITADFSFPKNLPLAIILITMVDLITSEHSSIHMSATTVQPPYLFMLTKSAMDIPINQGKDVLFYLVKYLSKVDSEVTLEHNMENTKDHMRGARVVGIVDAGYILCG
ncbi:hypothetical protein PS15m_012186 [Mucor circinelloides]